ncbi:alpha/beta fold hydrolase [Bacillus litorisediminis]|uniref:alpha/beta fold hydrolase n=1 Tax=Bacillus litorisediminis TaxID=2922713 RepID=UPI001FAFBB7C|nr:alpha/beta hydrolase [Bacillus litorisediminis]
MKSNILKVPGATLYYEVRGSGPLLLLIPGGPADAGVFTDLAEHLANHYMVVSYDPRGNSRSAWSGEPEEQQLDLHGDDAAHLIKAFGAEQAHVFGTSGGAQIALNLAARYPERVLTVVAHEPPCLQLLSNPKKALADTEEVYNTYLREGAGAAMQQFLTLSGMKEEMVEGSADAQPTAEQRETYARISRNLDYFLAHGLKPLSFYEPDVEKLREGSARIILGVGESSQGQIAYRTTVALAEKLDSEPVNFPGNHGGYGMDPKRFADILHHILQKTAMEKI